MTELSGGRLNAQQLLKALNTAGKKYSGKFLLRTATVVKCPVAARPT